MCTDAHTQINMDTLFVRYDELSENRPLYMFYICVQALKKQGTTDENTQKSICKAIPSIKSRTRLESLAYKKKLYHFCVASKEKGELDS